MSDSFTVHDLMDHGDDVRAVAAGNLQDFFIKTVHDTGIHAVSFQHDHVGLIEDGAQMIRGPFGDIGQPAGGFGPGRDVLEHAHEGQGAHRVLLLDVDRGDDRVHKDILIGDLRLVGSI